MNIFSSTKCNHNFLHVQVSEEEAPPPQYDESMTMGSNLASTNSNLASTNPSSTSTTPAVPMPTSTVQ